MMKFVILFCMLFSFTSQIKVKKEFNFCKPTSISIDLDVQCKDLNCIIYKNMLSLLAKLNDEFNFVYKPFNQRTVVYSYDGKIFYTDCKIIGKIVNFWVHI